MFVPHLILAVCWVVYCVLHSVLASLGVKKWMRQKTGAWLRYYRLFYTLFAALGLLALLAYQITIKSFFIYGPTMATRLGGSFLALCGLTLMAVCIKKYFFSLSGLKSLYQETPSAELMIAGIHRYMRHPLYTGTFLAIWGLWVVFPSLSLLIADVIITVYTLLAISLEEQKLIAEFGEPYRQYQQSVPKLIPRFILGRILPAEPPYE